MQLLNKRGLVVTSQEGVVGKVVVYVGVCEWYHYNSIQMYYDLKKCGDLLDIILHCSMKQKKERRTRKETQIAIAAVAFADDDDRLF